MSKKYVLKLVKLSLAIFIMLLCSNIAFAKSYKEITGEISDLSYKDNVGYMTIFVGPESFDSINLSYTHKKVPNSSKIKKGDKVNIQYLEAKEGEGDISGEIIKINKTESKIKK